MSTSLWVALMIAIALFAGVLLPYLIEEIKRGKMELGPRTPVGAGDTHPGYRGNPTHRDSPSCENLGTRRCSL